MKILQIIPAPEFMRGEYRRQDVYDEIYPIECRIACLALVEDDDGQREIKPVPYDCDDPYGILEPESPFRWLCEGEHLTEPEEYPPIKKRGEPGRALSCGSKTF